ncbi:MAG: FAD-dependent oxidoreductase, partial [Pseudonocardia sp.]|nr:FAD-dependent oxidoreductase [Pseudonocardia sp.]
MTTTEQDVVIVGAGPTGLTAACELAWRGVRVTVVDAAAGPSRGSRGKGLQPRSLELLDRQGLAGRLVSLGTSALPMRRYADGGYTDHVLQPGAGPTEDSPYGRPLMIPQWRTEQVLREHLAELGVEVRWDVRVTGLTQDTDGVCLSVDGGPDLHARYAVGCDGGSSSVRRGLGVSFLGETRDDIRMLLGDVTVEGLDRDRWHMWEPFVGLCPLPATEDFQFQAAAELVEGDPVAADFQAVLDRAGAGHVRIREVRWASQWRLNARMVDRFRVGRVFLAGDAAHVHSPAGAQGMNTGIGDAVNLGWKLAAVLAGADDALLETYEAERLPVAAEVLGLSGLLTERRIENRGAEGEQTLQLGLGYRDGPLATAGGEEAVEDPAGPVKAGDRAPDAPLGGPDGARMFDLFRHPGWTLLGFGPRPDAPSPAVRTASVGGAAAARRIYDATDGDLVLVRPDGYVALRTRRPADVESYLVGRVPSAGA